MKHIISRAESLQIVKNDLRSLALEEHAAELREANTERRNEILAQIENDVQKEMLRRGRMPEIDTLLIEPCSPPRKPVKAHWHRGPVEPDWLFIPHVTGQRGHDFFDLQSIKVWSSAIAGLTGSMSYETLPIAKGQAHADVGVEYVEWEPCNVEISNPDGSIDWGRALPSAEPGAFT